MSDLQGTFVWYELATNDVDGAIAFYGDVAGRGTEVFEGEIPYTIWKAGETGIGGVMGICPRVERRCRAGEDGDA